MPPNVNDIASDFALADSTGVRRTLGELVARERRVLLFYRGHW